MKENKIGLTPHINANKEDFAKIVLMPGDPKRAHMMANKFLEDPKIISNVRGIIAYTGKYKNKEVSIMAHGMGNPSIGIYSYELFKFYDVDHIIRVGSCAAYKKEINLYDIIVSTSAFSHSIYANYMIGKNTHQIDCSKKLLKLTKEVSDKLTFNNKVVFGETHTGDNFYFKDETTANEYYEKIWKKGLIAGEMEAFALYANAKALNKNAITLLTVAHHSTAKETTTSEERQNAFLDMMKLAFEVAIKL